MQAKLLAAVAALVVLLLSVSGCSEVGVGPTESLPVKMMSCDPGYTNCRLIARYDDMDSCKYHEAFANMFCDSVSQPGTITCKLPDRQLTAVGMCTE